MATKRPSVVEGNTPGKPSSKRTVTGTSRRSLFESKDGHTKKQHVGDWTEQEESCLVQYICLFWSNAFSDKWPTTKDMKFWNASAEVVNNVCNSMRTGGSCRTRVTKHLAKRYKTLSEAEESLNIDYMSNTFGCYNTEHKSATPKSTTTVDDIFSTSPVFKSSPIPKQENTSPQYVGDIVQAFLKCFKNSLSSRLKVQIINHLFKSIIMDMGGMEYLNFVGTSFLNTCFSAMKTLFEAEKYNLILSLCKCFERASVNDECRMPLDRMPFGLLDYNIRFFASDRTNTLVCEEHYASWLDTMFSQFGHKWLCLHRGPAWQYEADNADDDLSEPEQNSIMEKALQQSEIDRSTYDEDICIDVTDDLQATETMIKETSLCEDVYLDESLEILDSCLADFTIGSDASSDSLPTTTDDTSKTCVTDDSASDNDCKTNKLANLSHLWTYATIDDMFMENESSNNLFVI